jgi:hypothetical protein
MSDVFSAPDVNFGEPVEGDPYTQPLPQPGERIHSIMPEQEEVLGGSQPTGVIPMLGGGGPRAAPAEAQLTDLERLAQQRSAAHEGDQISTTVPTAGADAATAHTTFDRVIDTPAMSEDSPATMEKNAQIIRDYAGHTIPQDLSAADTIEAFKQHLKSNIIALHDAMPEDVRRIAMQWYDGANGMTHDMTSDFNATHGRGDDFNILPRQTAAVIASQSPQTDWYQNVSRAERILEIHRTQQDNPMTPEMVNWGQDYVNRMAAKGKPGAAVAQSFLDRNQGVPYSQMSPLDQAHYVRFHDEVYNPRTFDVLSPTGERLGLQLNDDKVTPTSIGWGSMPMIANATSVLQDGSLANISRNMGEAHKVRSFYNNIIAPWSNRGDTTVDTHAIAGANLFPLAGSDKMTSEGLGSSGSYNGKTGSSGLYPVYADAYREAARDLALRGGVPILPRQLQSMTWEGSRGLFPSELKAATSYRAPIEQVWTDHENGLLSQPDAQAGAIQAAGGVRRPDWAGPAPAGNAAVGNPANAPELSGRSLPGGGSGPAAGGARGAVTASPAETGLTPGDPFVTSLKDTRPLAEQEAGWQRFDDYLRAIGARVPQR